MFDIQDIRALYNGHAVNYTKHFLKRLDERKIAKDEVASAIFSGGIIEQILDDEPLPSVLILGYNDDGKPLHIAISIDAAEIWLVTAYYPTLDVWEADYKTRKVIL